jgi:aminopeptidase N
MATIPPAKRLVAVSLLIGMSACTPAPPAAEPGVSLALANHRAAVVSDVTYRLHLRIPGDPHADITGQIEISFLLSDPDTPLQLDFRERAENVLDVSANGGDTAFSVENEHIVVPASYLVAGSNTIEIDFIAGNTSLNRNPEYLYTLFVPDRARTAFPLFDQPNLKARYTLTLDIPSHWAAMSNAPVREIRESEDGRRYLFRESDLISSYLFSFVAGEFETISREVNGREMTMLHRETDQARVERNIDAIFDLHATALDWLEEYTGIDYPYQKFGFALIPAFQYGGMEHVGAIQYRASSLFLDEAPSQTRLLSRAGLIAHETAHMWFGNLVTMEWFNDVWTKEVFANFMAAKIVNPSFPEVNHDLNFLVRHYPSAYSVDRTGGANPIRQMLPNLNEAGQMYGAIIYNKAPIMMRQLELLIGEDRFRQGMQEYLETFSFANATWPALIGILDARTETDLRAWSEVWVNSPGRPEFRDRREPTADGEGDRFLIQDDLAGTGRVWPQRFALLRPGDGESVDIVSIAAATTLPVPASQPGDALIFNADGLGYGLFPVDSSSLDAWPALDVVSRASLLINIYENLLNGTGPDATSYFEALADIAVTEDNQLVLNLALNQLQSVYWLLLPVGQRLDAAAALETRLWKALESAGEASRRKVYFDAVAGISLNADQVQRVYSIWAGEEVVENLPLSENDLIDLAQLLAIKMPDRANSIVEAQLERTENPDNFRKLRFIAPSLSADQATRDRFFAALAEDSMRETESWVLDALANLHHPLRSEASEQYILPSLELLQEIQVTGDIFFPKRWLDATLGNYRTGTAVNTVRTFLDERPDYNKQLRMKILQSADMMFRANTITSLDQAR